MAALVNSPCSEQALEVWIGCVHAELIEDGKFLAVGIPLRASGQAAALKVSFATWRAALTVRIAPSAVDENQALRSTFSLNLIPFG
jgi:hypothetical protein